MIENWEVDFGLGGPPTTVRVPHSWGSSVPVSWEGPAWYRTRIDVPDRTSWPLFEGVSYEATIAIDGQEVLEHRGIWDAFAVPLAQYRGRTILVEVKVIKNGGDTFPVDEVASGFLPFVFQTFGGIFGEVHLVESDRCPIDESPPPSLRASVDSNRVFVDGKPFYARGALSWGWYPALGHPTPQIETIEQEIGLAKKLGFNLIKFCLWVPPHTYLEAMDREGMMAWIELPLWDPTADSAKQALLAEEMRRIVLQYRRHTNVLFWTTGCELNEKVPAGFRRDLYQMVRDLTGSPLVKDNSGGSEMYGGDLREFGDF